MLEGKNNPISSDIRSRPDIGLKLFNEMRKLQQKRSELWH